MFRTPPKKCRNHYAIVKRKPSTTPGVSSTRRLPVHEDCARIISGLLQRPPNQLQMKQPTERRFTPWANGSKRSAQARLNSDGHTCDGFIGNPDRPHGNIRETSGAQRIPIESKGDWK
jgi:hypothetical protein